jgi:hypothetical protein
MSEFQTVNFGEIDRNFRGSDRFNGIDQKPATLSEARDGKRTT